MQKAKVFLVSFVFSTVLWGQSLYFPPLSGDDWESISPESLGWCADNVNQLYDFLELENTKAFILLKDGKIVLEKYFDNHTVQTLWYWASAGKVLTAFATGIAQQESLLSISDTTSHYLGIGWTSCTPEQEEKITIWHQLTMTTGLDDEVDDSHCTNSTCLQFRAEPSTRWAYHNAPYTLLHAVVENATGMTINSFLAQKLMDATGMTGAFLTIDYNKVFFSNARSMARFGILILNNGSWDGNQIMTDSEFFGQMVTTSQSLNESYGYLWWLNGKSTFMVPGLQHVFNGSWSPNAPDDMFAALGKNGQFLNIVSSQNLIWLRMGDSPDGTPAPFLLNDAIWQRINQLECEPQVVSDLDNTPEKVKLFPNPTNNQLNIQSQIEIEQVRFFNSNGQLVKVFFEGSKKATVLINELLAGYYYVEVLLADGVLWHGKFLKW